MIKKFGLFLLTIAFLLCGCTSGSQTSNSNPSVSDLTSESVSSPSVEGSDPSISTSQSESNIEREVVYYSDSWDENLLDAIGFIAGNENKELVPAVTAESFEYFVTIDEATSLDLLIVNCYGINSKTIQERYETSLELNGFQLSYDSPYGWLEVSATEDLVVQYDVLTTGVTYFELLIYKVEMRIDYWPEEAIKSITAEYVPVVAGRSYEAYVDFTIDYKARISIYVYHSEIKNVDLYESELINAGYTVTYTTYGYDEATSALGTHIMYTYDLESEIFVLYIYNDWPYLDINYYLGMDLPRLDVENAVFDYAYVGSSASILTLYYDYVNSSSLAIYGSQLEEIGFVQDGNESTTIYNEGTANQVTVTSRNYVMNADLEDEHYISLMYCLEQQSLAIAIYY
ncbi:MAG: hypothetical protein J1F31_02570 [Erysipelotrichales bacterium]|nr:hypothetical protein [Erysipelotrichales bacterium]